MNPARLFAGDCKQAGFAIESLPMEVKDEKAVIHVFDIDPCGRLCQSFR